LKYLLLLASVPTLLGGLAAFGQVKSAAPPVAPIVYSPRQAFSPVDMKTMGTIDNGQTVTLMDGLHSPKYRALVFEGKGHDQVEITVTGGSKKTYVALADSSLTPIASGMGRLATSLPYHGPDTEAFYILIMASANQRLAVHFKDTPVPADATH
jgi:hypothetical protein